MAFSTLENFLSMFTDGKGQIDGKAIKTAYIGRGGVARKFNKGYISANGVAQIFFSGFDIASMTIGYTGNHTDQVVTMGDGKQYRLLTLTSSGTLTLEKEVSADIWVCNGGSNGAAATQWNSSTYKGTGDGGSGGKFGQGSAKFSNAVVTVASAAGTSKFAPTGGTAVSASVSGGGGGKGALTMNYGSGGAKAGGDTRPFKDSYFTKYPCAGGGGGNCWTSGNKSYTAGGGGSSNSAGATGTYSSGGAGGVTGGGNGGQPGKAGGAASYYGSGGGGGGFNAYDYYDPNEYTLGSGGKGYQGVVFIRIPLEQSA